MRVLLWFVHVMPNCNVPFFLIAQLQIVLFLCFSFLQVMIIIEGVDIEDLQEKMESGRYSGDSFCDLQTYKSCACTCITIHLQYSFCLMEYTSTLY